MNYLPPLRASVVALILAATPTSALTLSFTSFDGYGIRFDGNNTADGVGAFQFYSGPPTSLFIVTRSDGLGDARDKFGRLDGPFSIGAITAEDSRETASVTGQGRFLIRDGAGFDLSGALVFHRIVTEGNGGVINPEGWANLFDITYQGAVADFVALASARQAAITMTFQFTPRRDLTQLTRDGSVNTTSFSGEIVIPAVVPEPGGLSLMVFLLPVVVARRITVSLRRSHSRSPAFAAPPVGTS